MRRAVLLAAVALVLTACDRGDDPRPAPLPPAPEPVSNRASGASAPPPPQSASAASQLTSEGLRPVRIGMSEADAARALGPGVQGATGEAADCHFLHTGPAPANLLYMVEGGRVTRVTAHRDSPVKTDRGVGVGDTEAEIRAAYGAALREEPHKYVDAPAKYLTVWTRPNERGVRFELSAGGVVSHVHAGDATIQYVEGCS